MLVVSIGVFRAGRVLLIERAKPPAKGLFTFPGGRLEPGETMAEAVLRELAEETGITAELAGFAGHVEMISRGSDGAVTFHAVIAAFAGRWLAGECVGNDEIASWRYVRPDELPGLPTTPELGRIVAAAQRLVEA
jgi:ADP-ribose pyrophosphatase YjhB (NUDIX family)